MIAFTNTPKFEDLPEQDFYFKRRFDGERFAYLVGMLFGRARINVTTLSSPWSVEDFY